MHVDFQTKDFDLRVMGVGVGGSGGGGEGPGEERKKKKSSVHVGSWEVFMNVLRIREVVTVMS